MLSKKRAERRYSVFNQQYQVIDSLGEGMTSKVFLCRSLKDPSIQVALKLIRQEFIIQEGNSLQVVEQEIEVLNGISHKNVTQILDYGTEGVIIKPSGREIQNLVYIVLEYVSGGLFYDLIQSVGKMGENGGRFFMDQLADVLECFDNQRVAHRDLKLENILFDEDMNMKITDFGFATHLNVDSLQSYRGSKAYMAPEIKDGRTYDGRQSDMFSVGVILFIIVLGIFPFPEANKKDSYYKLIYRGDLEKYWQETSGQFLSPEFKDLIISMLSYDPSKRPTISELKNHPWMRRSFGQKAKQTIIQSLRENRYEKTTDDSDTQISSK